MGGSRRRGEPRGVAFILVLEPEVEEEVAEPRRRKKEEPIEPSYDIHPGSEDVRTLRGSGAIIY